MMLPNFLERKISVAHEVGTDLFISSKQKWLVIVAYYH